MTLPLSAPTHRQILASAIPIILANSATPLLGLTDIAVIGHYGSVSDLGAIALGSLLFSFLFWGFGFLRMSTSGFVAQASGRNDTLELIATLTRALLLAFAIGALLIASQWPIAMAAMKLLGASENVERIARDYFYVRVWSAPATLGLYVLMGFFIGTSNSRFLLIAQLILNGLNIALDILFAGVAGWGARGIAFGTALAEWLTLFIVAAMTWRLLRTRISVARPQLFSALRDQQKWRAIMSANGDILLRTLSLLSGFAIFTGIGARFGEATLAANHLLLQLISFSAFFLDGFAYVTEALVGRAHGAGERHVFALVVKRTTQLAAITAILLMAVLWSGGRYFIERLTSLEAVRIVAINYLPFCAPYILVSFAAFQLDGVFIGATQTRALRNASLIATSLFSAVCFPLAQAFGNMGLWSAFTLFVVLRAVALAAHYPRAFNRPA
ncbi:MAG: hypothetical protein JWM78_3104 [Verrucomicrobiaceae bacterium]|nr:hypothetical protein [Verrucomicrobiaceae bacterium]